VSELEFHLAVLKEKVTATERQIEDARLELENKSLRELLQTGNVEFESSQAELDRSRSESELDRSMEEQAELHKELNELLKPWLKPDSDDELTAASMTLLMECTP
jgi:hypothetical protein